MTTITPTDEQGDALARFATGESLVVEAGAGTGKTSTLRMLAASTPARGLYVAFNRAIVEDSARSMPSNVTCATVHRLAYRAVGADYRHRIGGARMKGAEIAKLLRIDVMTVTGPRGPKRLAPGYLASHTLRAVQVFCQSADDEPGIQHFPYIEGIDPIAADGRRGYTNNNAVARVLLPALHKAWADINSTFGDLPFNHGNYLKIWQLARPVLPFEFIMFDEAQDAAPVMAAVIEEQANYGAQLVFVGDSQQAIYGFTGAVNALAQLQTPNRTKLTRSFRFGPEIAAVANRILASIGADLRIEGAGAPGAVHRGPGPSPVRPDVVLSRTNATTVRRAMLELSTGGRPAIVGGADDVVKFAKAAESLRTEGWTSHPELACFKSWGEVQDYVDEDPNGGDLALLVKLVDEFGADVIIDSLGQCSDEHAATVVLSTAHKAKGREWDAVALADDFPTGFNADGFPIGCQPEELRLLYVAATRARLHLDTGGNPLLGLGPSRPVRIVELVAPLAPSSVADGTRDRVGRGEIAPPTITAADVDYGQTVRVTSDSGQAVDILVDILAPAEDGARRRILGKDSEGVRHIATLATSDRVLVVAARPPTREGSSAQGAGR